VVQVEQTQAVEVVQVLAVPRELVVQVVQVLLFAVT
jgi:hypothetical protein